MRTLAIAALILILPAGVLAQQASRPNGAQAFESGFPSADVQPFESGFPSAEVEAFESGFPEPALRAIVTSVEDVPTAGAAARTDASVSPTNK